MNSRQALAKREYLVPMFFLNSAVSRFKLHDLIGNVRTVTSGYSTGNQQLGRFSADALRKLYDRVRLLHAKTENNKDKVLLYRLQRKIETSVDMASREVVLGVKPRNTNAAKKLTSGTHFRFYIHTLDDKPAVFMGNRLEHTAQAQQHNAAATSIAQIHREQRAVFKAAFALDPNLDRGELQRRMGYRSFKVEG